MSKNSRKKLVNPSVEIEPLAMWDQN